MKSLSSFPNFMLLTTENFTADHLEDTEQTVFDPKGIIYRIWDGRYKEVGISAEIIV